MSNIVMAVKGTGGDLFPFSRIGTLLKQRGHDVVLIHDIEQPFSKRFQGDMTKMFGLNYVAIEPEQEGGVTALPHPNDQPRGLGKRSLANTDDYDPALELYEFNAIAGHCQGDDTILIVHKNLHLVTEAVAEKLELPMVSIHPGPFYLTSLPILADVYRMRAETVNRFRAEVGLPPAHDWQGLLWSSDMNIGLWPEWYAAPESYWPSPMSLVGFLCDYADESARMPQEVEDFLAGGEPPVLITHGTTPPERPGFFSSSAEACRQLDLRAILVSRHEELVPNPLPDKVKWFSYLPLKDLMPRMRAIIHHGGIGTTAQALAAGIPQLVLGFNYDRPDNGIRLRELGVGQFLPSNLWDPHTVADALRDLLESPLVQQCCEDLSEQSNYPDAAAKSCDIIETLVAHRSSSVRATKKHLTTHEQTTARSEKREANPADVVKALSDLSEERRALLALRLRKK